MTYMNNTRTARPLPLRLVALLAALATALLTLGAPLPERTTSWRAYIVDADAILPVAARVLRALPIADALLVSSPVAIAGATPADTPLQPEALALGEGPSTVGARLDSGVASTGAAAAWDITEGERAVVALIDTGVAPVPALDGAVAGEIDFTGTGGGDGHGHGTFLASLIAGRGELAPGVAPGAGILSLKVGAPDGSTNLGHVMTALEWLHGPGRAAGIRVAALALGVEPGTDAAQIVDRGVDALAKAGVLVVTAAGNDGPGVLTSPATAKGSFSVGSVNDHGTPERSDDVPSDFSGTGVDRAGVAQPDAVASGVGIVGSLPAGSVVANAATPNAAGLYSGSGTSMSTALAAGVAALASSARPDLDGAALDAALRAGGGELDAPATVAAALAAPSSPGKGRSEGRGDRDSSNIGDHGKGGPGLGHVGPGHVQPGHVQPGHVQPGSVRWTSVRWTSVRWTSVRWTGSGWGDADWPMADWASVRWTGAGWELDPQSVRWTSVRWTSVRWTSVRWTSVRWTSVRWT